MEGWRAEQPDTDERSDGATGARVNVPQASAVVQSNPSDAIAQLDQELHSLKTLQAYIGDQLSRLQYEEAVLKRMLSEVQSKRLQRTHPALAPPSLAAAIAGVQALDEADDALEATTQPLLAAGAANALGNGQGDASLESFLAASAAHRDLLAHSLSNAAGETSARPARTPPPPRSRSSRRSVHPPPTPPPPQDVIVPPVIPPLLPTVSLRTSQSRGVAPPPRQSLTSSQEGGAGGEGGAAAANTPPARPVPAALRAQLTAYAEMHRRTSQPAQSALSSSAAPPPRTGGGPAGSTVAAPLGTEGLSETDEDEMEDGEAARQMRNILRAELGDSYAQNADDDEDEMEVEQ